MSRLEVGRIKAKKLKIFRNIGLAAKLVELKLFLSLCHLGQEIMILHCSKENLGKKKLFW